MSSSAGSNAGRGFRFQDAVIAWLAAASWDEKLAWGLVIPEGGDDAELRGDAGAVLVQIKSRRAHLGPFSAGEAAAAVRELWDRHDRTMLPPTRLMLALERPVVDEAAAAQNDELGHVILGPLRELLAKDSRASTLLEKTRVLVISAPQEAAIDIVVKRKACTPLAAQICFAELLHRVGQLSDDNGTRDPETFAGLSRGDVDHAVDSMLGSIDPSALEAAIKAGLCEAVDFLTPLPDPNFYLGVDVEPGHLAAGLVAERPEAREAIAAAVESRRNCLVVGPSGAGKSAMMWDGARSLRHTVRWFRVRRLSVEDVPALRRLASTFRAQESSPVGFVLDDVGKIGADAWNQLASDLASVPGVVLLGSVREEDIFLLTERYRAVELRAEPSEDLAERIYSELRAQGATTWAGWREAWDSSEQLLLEYVFILTQGERMSAVLARQVHARVADVNRENELEILRVGACAGAAGARVDTARLAHTLALSEATTARALARLIDEHLVTSVAPGMIGGLHQLRSVMLLELSHATPPPTYARSFERTLLSVPTDDVQRLVEDAVVARQIATRELFKACAKRLEQEGDGGELIAILGALSAGHIAAHASRWLALPDVAVLPRAQVTLAAMFGVTGVSVPNMVPTVKKAAEALSSIMKEAGGDPRAAFVKSLKPALVAEMIGALANLHQRERLIAALIGLPISPELIDALALVDVDLMSAPLDEVVSFLGTLAIFDRGLATTIVDHAGGEALLMRAEKAWPWAGAVTLSTAGSETVVSCDLWYVAASQQKDMHAAVVALCNALLALCPRADVVASNAISVTGDVAGFGDVPLASARVPRANLPPPATPEWNRRWIDAIASRVASKNYTEYLADVTKLADEVSPLLVAIFNTYLRGKKPTEEQSARAKALFERAGAVTPPGKGGKGNQPANQQVTKLQHVLHQSTTEVYVRIAGLPNAVGSCVAWLGGLIESLNEAIAEEPWSLVSDGPPESVLALRQTLQRLYTLVGECAARDEAPNVTWRKLARDGQPRNALRSAAAAAEKSSLSRTAARKARLEAAAKTAGLDARVYLRPDPKSILPWPPVEALVLVLASNVTEVFQALATAMASLRPALEETLRLTIVPVADGMALRRFTMSGQQTFLPLIGNADAWLEELGVSTSIGASADAFDLAVAYASELASMDKLGLGVVDRPQAERTTRDTLEEGLQRSRAAVEAATSLDEDSRAELLAFVHDVRSGAIDFAGEVQAQLKGLKHAPSAQFVSAALAMLLQAELDERRAKAS